MSFCRFKFGKALAASLNKPFIAVNHLEGHALSPKLNSKLNYPYLLLLISGGHSQYLSVKNLSEYKRLGTTIDDAVGEAFDKTAKLLGIEFPGGPQIEVLAKKEILIDMIYLNQFSIEVGAIYHLQDLKQQY